ncbi:C1 family peptidase [Alistipes sp.]|uniref:aminopeptidase C n=1 Tax=Alistipes sp. TaxID=1872444 RepID=UPI000E97CED8|nr:C1 family peptidase [Alistipes sp.]HBX90010.1 aminopeptidase [Alistipes sp.]HCN13928.1 aminopeptidase [Alistipes sp.]
MKRFLLCALAFCTTLGAAAQTADTKSEPEGYRFTDGKVLDITPVKNQNRSGTCWCYSTMSFLEAEILRAGGAPVHLSEMWIVRHTFMEKAEKYVRMHGEINFAEGGAAHDVTEGIAKYGIVPFEAYPGFNYGTDKPDFSELTPVLKSFLDTVIKGRKLSTAWKRAFNALLDEYFGPMPETFVYEGKEYTPASFAASLPIRMDDYIDITSFTHHPFYTKFIIEIPDNWMWGEAYNLPLDEMMQVVDHALANGYPLAWGTDVSEKGFSRTKALGIIPEADLDGMSGTEAERWGKLTEREKEAALYKFDKPGKERTITQQMRQEAFDNYETTDDHGMVIVGTATDQIGNPYYKVLNSWDAMPPYGGYYYFSRPFVEYKTTDIMVNKRALPKAIAAKLGLK